MKIILLIIAIIFGLKVNIHAIGINNNIQSEKTVKLQKFNQNIDAVIEKDLQELNGYIRNKIIKNFQGGSPIIQNLHRCKTKNGTNLIRGNIGSRIYVTQCYKKYKSDFYTVFNKKNINNIFDAINKYLTMKHNF